MKKLYLISEENHSDLAVAEDVYLGVKYLLENDWLLPVTEGIFSEETILPVWKYIGLTQRASCTKQDIYLFFANKTPNEVIEELEYFGLYLQPITFVES